MIFVLFDDLKICTADRSDHGSRCYWIAILKSSISKYKDRHTHPKARHIAIYTKHKECDEESNHFPIKYRNSSGPIRYFICSKI